MAALLNLVNKYGGVGRNSFSLAHKAQLFGGGGLDGKLVRTYIHKATKHLLHLWNVGVDFGLLETDGGVQITHFITLAAQQRQGFLQEYFAVDALELRIGVGKMKANVPKVGGAQQGVAQGVNEYVAVRMTNRTLVKRNLNAANP